MGMLTLTKMNPLELANAIISQIIVASFLSNLKYFL